MIASIQRRLLLVLVCCPGLLPLFAHAHKASDSYLSIWTDRSRATGQWDIALRDLEQAVKLDANGDGNFTWDEVREHRQEIDSFATSRLRVFADDQPCTIEITDHLVEEFTDGPYAVLRFTLHGAAGARTLQIDYLAFFETDPQHRGLMRIESGDKTQAAVFSPESPTQRFELAVPSRWRQFLEFCREGVWHIWLGFDHILFLLALLLPSVLRRGSNGWEIVDRFRPAFISVLKIVTAFTVAHSITLSLATLQIVQLPSRLVESTIAASVILAALNNVRPIFPDRGWLVAFAFGLMHGFGFANVLSDLGLSRHALALSLVGFNVGVEIGQLAIVAVFLPLAYGLRGSWVYQRLTFQFGSATIAVLAATWMVERIWEFKLLPF